MKYLFSLIGLLLTATVVGQPLRDINYRYLYDPGEPYTFTTKTVRNGGGWSVFYRFQLRDTSFRINDFAVQWATRENLNEKEGVELTTLIQDEQKSRHSFSGRIDHPLAATPKVLAAKIVQVSLSRAWYFYTILEPNYPVTTYAVANGEIRFEPFVSNATAVTIKDATQSIVSYYNDNFPAALPPFAESQGRVSRGMQTDSTFFISGSQEITFSRKGLYLIQGDTSSAEGLALRAEDDYPRLARIPSLAGPMLYICTKQEYDRLTAAKVEKKTFDRIILGITNDTDRARKLIRNYFRRVELANQYFTSYKEGWKTDRGMIYIVFGLPDEVFRFNDREVWSYKNDDYKVTFDFTKASSLFDPDNYVLLREKKYQQTWYEVIDLWRNARF